MADGMLVKARICKANCVSAVMKARSFTMLLQESSRAAVAHLRDAPIPIICPFDDRTRRLPLTHSSLRKAGGYARGALVLCARLD
jgi:hypothetical protein